jgi:hypothetical protein
MVNILVAGEKVTRNLREPGCLRNRAVRLSNAQQRRSMNVLSFSDLPNVAHYGVLARFFSLPAFLAFGVRKIARLVTGDERMIDVVVAV